MSERGRAEIEEIVLTTPAGEQLLNEVMSVERPRPADVARWRKLHPAELVAAAITLVDSRRRGRVKFSKADEMWLDPVGLEQSTGEIVSAHKAQRFRNSLVVDLCSGIGGDTLALASVGHVLAVDIDDGMVRRTRWNAKAYGVSDRLAPFRSPAEEFPMPPDCYVHIDPDRRSRTRFRARSVSDYVPGLDFLLELPRRLKAGAIKLSPASDFAAHFSGPEFEAELISLGGECKEATLWFGRIADCRRRATVLPSGASWTDRDGPRQGGVAPTAPLSDWIFDPDPSLIRSGLLDAFAVANGLSRFADGIDLLSGANRMESPFLAAFRVDTVLPLDMKKLKRVVAERQLGPLEIKTRGLELTPETIRERLRPEGPNPATLILVGGAGPSMAILAYRDPIK